MTQCTPRQLEFPAVGRRRIVGRFDGGTLSSDAGALLLKDVEGRTGLLSKAAGCFTDHRCPERIEHTVEELVSQRVMGLALGYEDLNDHDELRHDALLAAVVGKSDPSGESRVRERDQGKALAGKTTLNRLELTGPEVGESERYKKVIYDASALDRLFVEHFIGSYGEAPDEVVQSYGSDAARNRHMLVPPGSYHVFWRRSRSEQPQQALASAVVRAGIVIKVEVDQ